MLWPIKFQFSCFKAKNYFYSSPPQHSSPTPPSSFFFIKNNWLHFTARSIVEEVLCFYIHLPVAYQQQQQQIIVMVIVVVLGCAGKWLFPRRKFKFFSYLTSAGTFRKQYRVQKYFIRDLNVLKSDWQFKKTKLLMGQHNVEA